MELEAASWNDQGTIHTVERTRAHRSRQIEISTLHVVLADPVVTVIGDGVILHVGDGVLRVY